MILVKVRNLTRVCEYCKSTFTNIHQSSRLDWSKKRFCSRECYSKFGRTFTDSHKRNISNSHKGKVFTTQHKERIANSLRLSEQAKATQFKKGVDNIRYGKGHLQKGKLNPYWRNGATDKNQKIRNAPEYLVFRNFCLSRDQYRCTICTSTEYLQVHHIKSISIYPKLAYEVSNGKTVCLDCHEKIHGRPINFKHKYYEQAT